MTDQKKDDPAPGKLDDAQLDAAVGGANEPGTTAGNKAAHPDDHSVLPCFKTVRAIVPCFKTAKGP